MRIEKTVNWFIIKMNIYLPERGYFMAVFKCKMCGGELELQAGSNIVQCPYCGTKQTVPTLDDKLIRLYNRANQYRLNSDFDKAYSAYEAIVSEKNDEAEAYWGMVLSEFGVE
jgi:DNA-directed RNA polymerase subunit RPC12/RpoP